MGGLSARAAFWESSSTLFVPAPCLCGQVEQVIAGPVV